MNLFVKDVDEEVQYLVAIGAAVASGCQPCLEKIVAGAQNTGIDAKKMKSAAIIGQFVKDQPAAEMKRLADQLLGTHLSRAGSAPDCPLSNGSDASAPQDKTPGTTSAGGCGA
jgi:hypothetical protein